MYIYIYIHIYCIYQSLFSINLTSSNPSRCVPSSEHDRLWPVPCEGNCWLGLGDLAGEIYRGAEWTWTGVPLFGKGNVSTNSLDVSENNGFSPRIIHFNRVFHYKPIHFGVPLFLETPICCWGSISRFFGRSTKVNHFRRFYRTLKYLNTHVNVPSDEEPIEMSTSKIKWNQVKSVKSGKIKWNQVSYFRSQASLETSLNVWRPQDQIVYIAQPLVVSPRKVRSCCKKDPPQVNCMSGGFRVV